MSSTVSSASAATMDAMMDFLGTEPAKISQQGGSGIFLSGVIKGFNKWNDTEKRFKMEDTIWPRVKGKGNSYLPYTMVFQPKDVPEVPGKVEYVKDDNGNVEKIRFLTQVAGIFTKDKDTKEEKPKYDKELKLYVLDVLKYYWNYLKNDSVSDEDKQALPSSIHWIIETFMEQDKPEVKRHVWVEWPVHKWMQATFSMFDNESWDKFKQVNEDDKLYKMRKDATITFSSCQPNYRLYLQADKNGAEPTTENPFSHVRFGYITFDIRPYEYSVDVPKGLPYEQKEAAVDDNEPLLVPIEQYKENSKIVPSTLVVKVANLDGSEVVRRIHQSFTESDYVTNNKERCWNLKYMDMYQSSGQGYRVQAKIFSVKDRKDEQKKINALDYTGIMSPDVWKAVAMACQPFYSYLEGSIYYKATMEQEFSMLPAEARATRFPANLKGDYVMWPNKVYPHWQLLQENYMFPISKAKYYSMLKKYSSGIKDKSLRPYKSVVDEDGATQRILYNAFPHENNLLHGANPSPPVINLGNVSEPCFASQDLDYALEDRDLYVLSSFVFGGSGVAKPATEAEGDAFVDRYLDQNSGLQYQVFAFQTPSVSMELVDEEDQDEEESSSADQDQDQDQDEEEEDDDEAVALDFGEDEDEEEDQDQDQDQDQEQEEVQEKVEDGKKRSKADAKDKKTKKTKTKKSKKH